MTRPLPDYQRLVNIKGLKPTYEDGCKCAKALISHYTPKAGDENEEPTSKGNTKTNHPHAKTKLFLPMQGIHRCITIYQNEEDEESSGSKGPDVVVMPCQFEDGIVVASSPEENDETYAHVFTVTPAATDDGKPTVILWTLPQLMLEQCPLRTLLPLIRKDGWLWDAFFRASVFDVHTIESHFSVDYGGEEGYEHAHLAPMAASALAIVCTLRLQHFQEHWCMQCAKSEWVEVHIVPLFELILQWHLDHNPEDGLCDRRQHYVAQHLMDNIDGSDIGVAAGPFSYNKEPDGDDDGQNFVQLLLLSLEGTRAAESFDFGGCEILLQAALKLIPKKLHAKVFQQSVATFVSTRWDDSPANSYQCHGEPIEMLFRLMDAEHDMGKQQLSTLWEHMGALPLIDGVGGAVVCDGLSQESRNDGDDEEAAEGERFFVEDDEFVDDDVGRSVRTSQMDLLSGPLKIPPAKAKEVVFARKDHVRGMSPIFADLKRQGDIDTSTLRAFETALYHYVELAVKHHRPRVVWALLAMFPHLKHMTCDTEIRKNYTLFQYSVWCALKPNIFGRDVTNDHNNPDTPRDDAMRVVVQLLDRNRNSRINEQHPVSGNTVLHMLLKPLENIVRRGYTDYWQHLTMLPPLLTWAISHGADATIANAEKVTAYSIAETLLKNEDQHKRRLSCTSLVRHAVMRELHVTLLRDLCKRCKRASKAKRRRSDDKGGGAAGRSEDGSDEAGRRIKK